MLMSILWHSKRMHDWWMTEDEKDWKNVSLMKVIVFFYTMSFNVYRVPEWVFQYRNTWNEMNRKYLKNWQQNLQKEKVNAGMVTWNYGQNTLGKFFMVKMLHVACIGIKQQGWRLTVYTDSAKIIILMCMLKSVNTLRLKASNKACWVI